MTQLLSANIGSYPRIGEEKDQQRHRRGLTHYQNQDISAHAFRDVEQSVTQEVVREQITAGLDEITDGLVSWMDPISRFCTRLSGVTMAGLDRYFDTNFYYRIPVFISKPKKKEPLLVPEFQYARDISSKPVRVVLTGPYTLARHTQGEKRPYDKWKTRFDFFTELLSEEIKHLVKQGAKLIQIDEPSLTQFPEDLPHLKKSLQTLRQGIGSSRFMLYVGFAPLTELYTALSHLPVDALLLDFSYDGKKLLDKIMKSPARAPLGFGLINARTTRLEPIDPAIYAVRQWIEKHRPSLCYVTPSAGLEFLPRNIAFAKLKLLSKIRDESAALISRQMAHA